MGIGLMSVGGVFGALATLLFFEASRAKDPFAMSFSLDLALVGAVLIGAGAIVRAVDKLRSKGT